MLHLYYGKGKGKTSAALGLILRAAGHKKRIILVQFLKPKDLFSGEFASLKKLANVEQVRFDQRHPIFMQKRNKRNIDELSQRVQESISILKGIVKKGCFDILVCDEMLNLIDMDLIKENDIITIFGKLKDKKEIVLTGMTKPKILVKIADYATEFRLVKHPFQKGILARKAVEH